MLLNKWHLHGISTVQMQPLTGRVSPNPINLLLQLKGVRRQAS